jgi:hypothetical protein
MSLRDEVANTIAEIVHKAVIEHLRRERAGASASMNGALEYVDFTVADAILPLVIEQCAKVAEAYEVQHELNEPIARNIRRNIAAAIRNLGREA